MAKIKHTKNELKAQNEALRRYCRFLPMLQLKKQQLQSEIQMIDNRLEEQQCAFKQALSGLQQWVSLFSESIPDSALVSIERLQTDTGNIAGVNIPILKEVLLRRPETDLFETPAWLDDAEAVMDTLLCLKAETDVLQEQRRLITEELRTTAQRVNLFEKIKIPECRENIRIIKIFLGDEQTAAVARGKLAKKRTQKTADDTPAEATA